MPHDSDFAHGYDLSWWCVGARVFRKRSDTSGTVVEMTGHVKVKWDDGKTSYYRPGALSNVRLMLPQAKQ